MYECLLPLKVSVIRIARKFLLNRKSDLLLHLRRCRLGKSNNEKMIYINSFIYHLYNALNKNSRLSRAGGCRYQYITFSGFYYRLLFISKLNFHFL